MNLNVGKPVTGAELIGREQEITEIIQTLKAGQSVALIAPRRFGKTSILMEALNRLESEKYFTGSVDIFTIPDPGRLAFEITRQVLSNRKLDEAFNTLKTNLGVILSNIKFRKEIEGSEFIMSFGKPQKEPWDQLKSALGYIESFSVKHKKKFCFGFDEFGDIEKLDGIEIIKMFRGIIQNQKQSVYIFSGSYETVMNRLFVTSKSPFFRMVRIIEPGFIDRQIVRDFVKSKFIELKIEHDEQHITDSAEFTRGHPYYVRLFIQEFYFWFLQNNKAPESDLIFKNMMLSENSYLEKLWDEVSKKRETKIVLMKIAETGKPYSGAKESGINISRAISDLLGRGIIFPDRSGYIFSDPLFENFINERIINN